LDALENLPAEVRLEQQRQRHSKVRCGLGQRLQRLHAAILAGVGGVGPGDEILLTTQCPLFREVCHGGERR
jgi:hypothetical protein